MNDGGFCDALVIELYGVCDPLALGGLDLASISAVVLWGRC